MKQLAIPFILFVPLLFGCTSGSQSEEKAGETEEVYETSSVDITIDELPEAVQQSVSSKYPESEPIDAKEVTSADGSITYVVKILADMGMEEVIFKADGTFVGKAEAE